MAEVEAFVNTAMVAVEQVGKDNTTGKNGVSKLFLAMIRESMTQVAKFKQDEVTGPSSGPRSENFGVNQR